MHKEYHGRHARIYNRISQTYNVETANQTTGVRNTNQCSLVVLLYATLKFWTCPTGQPKVYTTLSRPFLCHICILRRVVA